MKTLESYIAQYSPHVSRLCFFLCKNQFAANDLFQETWLKVMKNIGRFDEKRDFGKWVSTNR